MKINVEKFLTKEAMKKLSGFNLHKIAATMSKKAGCDKEEIDLSEAVRLLGMHAYTKNASMRKIFEGLEEVKEVLKGE